MKFPGILYTILFLLVFSSCLKSKQFPETPEIEYTSYTIGDTVDAIPQKVKFINIKFSFKDREGDIGLDKNETTPPYDIAGGYYYNLIASKYEKINGSYVFKSEEKSRIPKLSGYATKRGLQGYFDISYFLYLTPHTEFKYEIYIYDRALHKSNVISTPDIVF